MAYEFKLPDIGEGVVEGEIVKWLISAGDSVDVDQPLVEVMTDKATVVIPSPTAGTVKETIGAEGDLVEVGKVIALIEEGAALLLKLPLHQLLLHLNLRLLLLRPHRQHQRLLHLLRLLLHPLLVTKLQVDRYWRRQLRDVWRVSSVLIFLQ